MIAVKVTIQGRVQGVGYRWFAKEQAERLDLNGYVKNLYNGDVEVYAEGEREVISQYMTVLNQGPPFAHVLEIKYTEMETEGRYNRFQVEI